MQNKTALALTGSIDQDSMARQPWRTGVVATAAALALWAAAFDAHALALGAISVRSALGEPLRAEIEVPDISSQEAATFSASVASPQAFRAAGVEYTPALTNTRISLHRRANGQAYLRVTGERPINEPFLGIVIETTSSSGRVVRDYTMLVDPPGRAAPPAVAVNPSQIAPPSVTTPAPPAVAPTLPAAPAIDPAAVVQAPRDQTLALPRRAAPTAEGLRHRARAVAPAGDGAQVTVQRGDTASAIASAHAADGVSLDQMLVAMLRANPNAFIRGNVNRMKAGVVLNMPSAEQAAATSRQAARRAVAAQTRDFNAYRRGLALRSGSTRMAAATRSASGGVQPQVQESRPAAPAQDRLTLSRGGAPSATESKIAQSRQAQEQAARVAELNKNLSDLTQLQSASGSAPATRASVPGITVPIPSPVKPPAAPPASPAASAAPPAKVPAAALNPASDTASPATPAVTQPASAAETAARMESPASGATVASAVAPAASRPRFNPAPAPVEAPSFLDSLTENPMLPVAGAGLVALLAGYGLLYRSRQRKKKENAQLNSSFIESHRPADSFFGASGGQRVNTENSGSSISGSSSMSYSPSQLDAGGDVDPVAEADVYLAYGRDLQAEEILREALRTHPGRVAIHRKLVEIYAKRRDVRGLEAIAIDAYKVTQGQGSEWLAIASLGSTLDPSNPMYRPGGAPGNGPTPTPIRHDFGADTEPLGVRTPAYSPDTQPTHVSSSELPIKTVPPAGLPAAAAVAAGASSVLATQPPTAPAAPVPTPLSSHIQPPNLDLDIAFAPPSELSKPPVPSARISAPAQSHGDAVDSTLIDFELEALAADAGAQSSSNGRTRQSDDADEDPLGTKLALAREFHAIGDTEGARALLKEVIAESSGVMRTKAERFLSELG